MSDLHDEWVDHIVENCGEWHTPAIDPWFLDWMEEHADEIADAMTGGAERVTSKDDMATIVRLTVATLRGGSR